MKSRVHVAGASDILFTFEISHTDDFDPACMVCTESKKIVEKILGEWLCDAFIVELDHTWKDINTRNMLILKPSSDPMLARLLAWFVSNFDDTIKLAAVDTIVFRECDTANEFTCKIRY